MLNFTEEEWNKIIKKLFEPPVKEDEVEITVVSEDPQTKEITVKTEVFKKE